MTVLVDMDDVLNDLISAWCVELNKISDHSLYPKEIKYWEMQKNYPDLTTEEIMMPLQKREFWKNVRPKHDAPVVLKEIIDIGHKVFIVTASHSTSLIPKMNEMLFPNFPYLSWDNIIITSHKEQIVGDILIDDNLDNLLRGSYKKILFKSQTSIYDNIRNIDGIEICENWKEIRSFFVEEK